MKQSKRIVKAKNGKNLLARRITGYFTRCLKYEPQICAVCSEVQSLVKDFIVLIPPPKTSKKKIT